MGLGTSKPSQSKHEDEERIINDIPNVQSSGQLEVKTSSGLSRRRSLSIDSFTEAVNLPQSLSLLGYEMHQQIGYGTYSRVYVATNSRLPGVKFACKVFELGDNQHWVERFLKRELTIVTKLRHPNVVSAYDTYKTRTRAYIFMHFAENGSMDAYLRRIELARVGEPQCRKWFSGLMSGLRYLHRYNVAHRDLKPDNFLLNDRLEPLISDFSYAVIGDRRQADQRVLPCHTLCGSSHYLAPEVRCTAPDSPPYNAKKVDIYAMGVSLFELLHGGRPFEGWYCYDIRSKVLLSLQLSRGYRINTALGLTTECRSLIDALLTPDPNRRPTAKQVLAHDWFRRTIEQSN